MFEKVYFDVSCENIWGSFINFLCAFCFDFVGEKDLMRKKLVFNNGQFKFEFFETLITDILNLNFSYCRQLQVIRLFFVYIENFIKFPNLRELIVLNSFTWLKIINHGK
jgi:hypothetical protein